jgi:N6-adenosine-specific RNA methylase IME4
MNNKYNIIYSDPPWQYDDKMHAGERGVDYKYDTMTLSDICNLPVRKLAADNSRLFMWVTMPFIFEAEKVMNSWGFTYKTCGFVWIKTNPKGTSAMKAINALFKDKHTNKKLVSIDEMLPYLIKFCFMGNGSYTRSNPELCLIGSRGKLERKDASVRSVVFAPSLEHSAKPPEIRGKITQLYGDLPRLEMFARGKAANGWDVWGNQVENSINIFEQ